jgi:hypothetical protein
VRVRVGARPLLEKISVADRDGLAFVQPQRLLDQLVLGASLLLRLVLHDRL